MTRSAALPEARSDQRANATATLTICRRVQEAPAAAQVFLLEPRLSDDGHLLHHDEVQPQVERELD